MQKAIVQSMNVAKTGLTILSILTFDMAHVATTFAATQALACCWAIGSIVGDWLRSWLHLVTACRGLVLSLHGADCF